MPHSLAIPACPAPAPATPALLDVLEPLPGAHALVIGRDTLEILCGLIRRGCAGAAELRPDDSGTPRPDLVQVAVLPDAASLAEAAGAAALAWRVLDGGGRIALCDSSGLRRREFTALLRSLGFVAVATRYTPDGPVIIGQRPAAIARA